MRPIKHPGIALDAQWRTSNGAISEGMPIVAAKQALRQRAEHLAQDKSQRLNQSLSALTQATAGLITPEEMRQKMYELQVHQIELQMQNDELQRTQLELDAARARYFDLYDLAPVGYCTLSEADLIVDANLTAAALFGVTRSAMIGRPITRFICRSDQDTFYLQHDKLHEDGKSLSYDLRMQKADGSQFWALISTTLEASPDLGRQVRLVLSDISARRAAERSTLDYQARYHNLFISLDKGLCIIEVIFDASQTAVDYRFLEVNPAFEKQCGLTAAAGKCISELAPPIEAFWLELYAGVALTGNAVRIVHEAKSLGRWFEVHASLHGAAPSTHVAIIFSDVTERKLAELRSAQMDEELHKRNVALEQAIANAEMASKAAAIASQIAEKSSQAKSAFLSSMSHELRTPLNAILGFAQMFELGNPPPTLLQKRNIDQILKAGWYLLELINEVLDLSLVESGKVMLSREPVALADLLLECQNMIEPQAQKRGVSLHFPSLPRRTFVSADRTRFKQVLLNLLLNAIKYNRPNGSLSVECALVGQGNLRIGVRDTGFGMAPEQMAHLFQPFNRLGKEAGTEEGTGIGLVVTKRLVELMGGRIGVESTVDVGSLFWIELNVSGAPQFDLQKPDLPASEFNVIAPEVGNGASACTLLYVEDNPANLELVEQLVAMRSDLRLLSATDGSIGVEFARTLQPDVILMDINLPGISGIQALHILQRDQRTRHIPVIALSANAMANDIEQGLQLGFFQYLTKPIRVREFMQTLDDALSFSARTAAGAHIGAAIVPDPCESNPTRKHHD